MNYICCDIGDRVSIAFPSLPVSGIYETSIHCTDSTICDTAAVTTPFVCQVQISDTLHTMGGMDLDYMFTCTIGSNGVFFNVKALFFFMTVDVLQSTQSMKLNNVGIVSREIALIVAHLQ